MLCSCSSELLLWYNHNCRWPVITLSLMMAFGLLSAHGSFSIEQGSSGAPHLDKPTQHVDCFPFLLVSSLRLFFSSLHSLLLALAALLATPRATWYLHKTLALVPATGTFTKTSTERKASSGGVGLGTGPQLNHLLRNLPMQIAHL